MRDSRWLKQKYGTPSIIRVFLPFLQAGTQVFSKTPRATGFLIGIRVLDGQ
jgi:hypothetical protein